MLMRTCSACGGSGKERVGELVPGIDWSFDFSQGFKILCASQQVKDEYRDRCVAFLKTLAPGDRFMMNVQFEKIVSHVGMYDGWPYWRPIPAVAYVGPLGCIEYAFYYNISAPYEVVK